MGSMASMASMGSMRSMASQTRPREDLRLQDRSAMPLLSAPDPDYMENTSIRAMFEKVILKAHHGLYGKYKHLGDSGRSRRPRKRKKTRK